MGETTPAGPARSSGAEAFDLSRADVADLRDVARRVRIESVRAVYHGCGGHIGGPLSAADLLVALYFRVLRLDPRRPEWDERDRFVLSKGHAAIALYATMALRGFFSVDELATFDAINSRLQGHPDMTKLPGLDMSTGSLGLGMSAAVGIALGAKLDQRSFRVHVMLGDGECQEGIVWEAADIACRYGLDNLVAVVDVNRLQQYGWRSPSTGTQSPPLEPPQLRARWEAFGWQTLRADGHDFDSILAAFDDARRRRGCPSVILAETVKGKGVPFMEGDPSWHARVPNAEELGRAQAALSAGAER